MSAQQLRLYHHLQITAHDLKKAADRALADTGLTTAQVAVLAVVAAEGPIAQRTLALRLGVNESAVTAMARRVVELGLLSRELDGSDARVRLLVLTPLGLEALDRAGSGFATVNAAADGALDAAEVEVLVALLVRLRAAVADLHPG